MSDALPWPEAFATRYRAAGHWIGKSLASIVRDGARRWPQKTAAVDANRRCTYAQLEARTDRLAESFAALGINASDRVVVQLPNVIEFIEVTFALLKLGAVPIFALPGHREHELAYFCKHTDAIAYVGIDRFAGCDYRVLAHKLFARAPSLLHAVIVGTLEDAQKDDARFKSLASLLDDARTSEQRTCSIDASQVALMQLSGGSTGTPKLIARTHDDYFYSVRQSVPLCGFDESTVYLVSLPAGHNFPLSSPGILGCLFAGGTVVLSASAYAKDVFALVERERVTHAATVPSVAHLWLLAHQRNPRTFDSWKVLQVGGAKLAPAIATQLHRELGPTLQQVFGMAEGLVNYTRLDDPEEVITTTQGRPMSEDDELRIVDNAGQEVPNGQVGQLLTRGPYTIRGYFRADEHNAQVFSEDGFYRTGDLVRRTPSGNLVVEGRVKEQINRAGEKIAPVELEECLLRHPSIEDVAALGVDDTFVGERICVVVVLKRDATVSRQEVLAHIRDHGLATYKLPDRVLFVDALPKTNVGKTDKRSLAAQLSH